MNDRPHAMELVGAVRHFLETELLPSLTDSRLRFQTLIACNVLNIAEREEHMEERLLVEEWQRLADFLNVQPPSPTSTTELRSQVRELNRHLGESIRNGLDEDATILEPLIALLRSTVRSKLEIANHRFLGS